MRRYGQWAGNEKGVAEDPSNCIVKVWPSGRSMISYQCGHGRGHGKGGNFCLQHAKMIKKGRHLSVPKYESEATDG